MNGNIKEEFEINRGPVSRDLAHRPYNTNVSAIMKAHHFHSPLLCVRGRTHIDRWPGHSGLPLHTMPPGHSWHRSAQLDTLWPQGCITPFSFHTVTLIYLINVIIKVWLGLTDVAARSYKSCWTFTGSSGSNAFPSILALTLSLTVWTIPTLSAD